MELQGEDVVLSSQDVPLSESEGWIGAGLGGDTYHVALGQRLGSCFSGWRRQCLPRARRIADLGSAALKAGRAVAAETALLVHIGADVAAKPKSV